MDTVLKKPSNLYILGALFIVSLGFLLLHEGQADIGRPLFYSNNNESYPTVFYTAFFVLTFLLLHLYLRVRLPDADPFILPAIAILSGIGLIMLLRLSPDISISNKAIADKQMAFIVLGSLMSITVVSLFNTRIVAWLSSKKYIIVLASIGLIILTMLFGTTINNRTLWFFGIQSVEIVKLLMLFFISAYIYEKGRGIVLYNKAGFRQWLTYAGPFVFMWFFALLPIFIQKDLGPTFLIFLVFLVMFHYSGSRIGVTLFFMLMIVIIGVMAYYFEYPSIFKERWDLMNDPFGRNESMARALWALSSGGIFGASIGYGRPHTVPAVQSDFNFIAVCEELGIIGGLSIILAYVVLINRFMVIAGKTNNIYKKALVTAIAVIMGLQSFIIISGNLNIIPMTGITLPFVSYGGTSMVMSFVFASIAIKISGDKDE